MSDPLLRVAESLELFHAFAPASWPARRARIRLRPGAEPITVEAVRAFCAGKLAHYKIPRYVHVVAEFPMTVTGKIRKVEMRERAVEILRANQTNGG